MSTSKGCDGTGCRCARTAGTRTAATSSTRPNGVSRKTRTGAATQRRLWKCGACRKQFSVLTGSVMHGTKIPVRTWVFVLFEMCASKNGISAREIERRYDLTTKAAWFMAHRIREAMRSNGIQGMFTGIVVADETFIGGKAKNMHRSNPRRAEQKKGGPGKAAVLSLISDGQVRSKVIPDVTGASLRKALEQDCIPAETVLHTDEGRGYVSTSREFAAHETVVHSRGEYVRGAVSTNVAEGYFSQLKRSLDGTHHHVSREHLPRYLAEFDFRYNTRKQTDSERLRNLMSRVGGRRLTYRPLTAAAS